MNDQSAKTEQTLTDQFLVVRVDLIQEARAVAGALHEHPPLLEVGRPTNSFRLSDITAEEPPAIRPEMTCMQAW